MARQLGLGEKGKGVVVGTVLPNSPAAKAGLKPGDVITAFDGHPVVSLPKFRLMVAASESGREFPVTYWRDGKEQTTKIVPAPADTVVFEQEKAREKAADDDGDKDAKRTEKAVVGDFGLEVQALTPELAAQFGHPKDTKGLLVSDVKEGSPAADQGLEPGMLISKVVRNQRVTPLASVKEFQDLAGKSDELALYVQSPKGVAHFVTLSKSKK